MPSCFVASAKKMHVAEEVVSPSGYGAAVAELQRLGHTQNRQEMMKIIVSTANLVFSTFLTESTELGRTSRPIGADELFPVLLYVVTQACISHMYGIVSFLDNATPPSNKVGEASYYLATIIAAVQVLYEAREERGLLYDHCSSKELPDSGFRCSDMKDFVSTSSVLSDASATEGMLVSPKGLCEEGFRFDEL